MLRAFTAFSGYDSQCMALARAGVDYELVGWSEIDPWAVKAHDSVFPEWAGRNLGDVTAIDWTQVPDFDLFTYSFPCQSISTLGRCEGLGEGSGTTSSLLWECERAIAAKRPKYLLMENVPALLAERNLPDFRKWCGRLERLGYANFRRVLDALDFGVPQSRRRVLMVSLLGGGEFHWPEPVPRTRRLSDLLDKEPDPNLYLPERRAAALRLLVRPDGTADSGLFGRLKDGFKELHGSLFVKLAGAFVRLTAHGRVDETCAVNLLPMRPSFMREQFPTICTGVYSSDFYRLKEPGAEPRIRKPTAAECLRLMGVAEPDTARILAAVPAHRAYRLAGNSIVVDVLAAVFRKMFTDTKAEPGQQLNLFKEAI